MPILTTTALHFPIDSCYSWPVSQQRFYEFYANAIDHGNLRISFAIKQTAQLTKVM